MRLGDGVKAVTSALGVPTCESCEERRKRLNNFGAALAGLFGGKNGSEGISATELDGARGSASPGAGSASAMQLGAESSR